MRRLRDPNWVLILLFLGLMAAVPLSQTLMEATREDGVIALELFSQSPTAVNLRSFEKKLEETTWAAQLSRPLVQFAQFALLKYGGEKVIVGPNGWYFFKPGLAYMLAKPETKRTGADTNDPVAAIVHFRDELAARGFELLVVPAPNKETIYPDRLVTGGKFTRAKIALRTREVLTKLRGAKVEVVDLFQEFNDARKSDEGTPLYLAQDTHWSPRGVRIAAQAVASRLTELGWIRRGNVEFKQREVGVERVGDILQMLQSPKIQQRIAPEKVGCMQVLRGQNGEMYKDDPNAEVLVLGDSFMRIYQQDPPTSAGFVAHLAKELKQPVLSLVNDGGGATLVREELCARPLYLRHKRVVIWEFVERDIGLAVKGWLRTPLPAETPKASAHREP